MIERFYMIQIQKYLIMQMSLTLSFDVMINLIWSSTDVLTETTCIFCFAIKLLFIASINQSRWQRCWRNVMTEEIWRIYCFICRIVTKESLSSNWLIHEFAKISVIISQMMKLLDLIYFIHSCDIDIESIHERHYAMCIKWTKLSEKENRLSTTQRLHVVKTIMLRLCTQ